MARGPGCGCNGINGPRRGQRWAQQTHLVRERQLASPRSICSLGWPLGRNGLSEFLDKPHLPDEEIEALGEGSIPHTGQWYSQSHSLGSAPGPVALLCMHS